MYVWLECEVVGVASFEDMVLRVVETGSVTIIVVVVVLYVLKSIFNGLIHALMNKIDRLITLEENNSKLLEELLREIRERR